ncbi:MAG: hypothetical protein FD182_1695 [Fusobacteria bacterium]|nr:MAG: hypothetical protein FD182_1695 [Fusobacteriota bacterium]
MRNKKIIYRLIVLIGILILPIIVSKPVAAIVDLSNDGVIYSNYMQTKGYLPWVSDGEIAGITGMSC